MSHFRYPNGARRLLPTWFGGHDEAVLVDLGGQVIGRYARKHDGSWKSQINLDRWRARWLLNDDGVQLTPEPGHPCRWVPTRHGSVPKPETTVNESHGRRLERRSAEA